MVFSTIKIQKLKKFVHTISIQYRFKSNNLEFVILDSFETFEIQQFLNTINRLCEINIFQIKH